jgi:hypothetical protein
MRYTYDVYSKNIRVFTTTEFKQAVQEYNSARQPRFIYVNDNLSNLQGTTLYTIEDVEGHLVALEIGKQWKDKEKKTTRIPVKVIRKSREVVKEERDKEGHKPWNPLEEAEIELKHEEDKLVSAINKDSLASFVKMVEEQNSLGKTPVNPSHYQKYIDEYQWLEAMSRIQRYRDNPDQFKSAIELQVRKYLDRNGRKDKELQELEKGLWYMKALVYFTKYGKLDIKHMLNET